MSEDTVEISGDLPENSDGLYGTKELEEVIDAADAIALCLIKKAQDGFDLSDVLGLLGDDEVIAAVAKAADGISQGPKEAGDLSGAEYLHLAQKLIRRVPAYVDAFRSDDVEGGEDPAMSGASEV